MSGPSSAAGIPAGAGAGGIRPPAFAGSFYPDNASGCRQLAQHYVSSGRARGAGDAPRRSGHLLGGIVPHAGWICSGAVAGETIGTIAAGNIGAAPDRKSTDRKSTDRKSTDRKSPDRKSPDVVVVFAAVHTPAPLAIATLDTFAAWSVPGGSTDVSGELRAKLIERGGESTAVALGGGAEPGGATSGGARSSGGRSGGGWLGGGRSGGALFVADDRFHRREHAVEVELPLIQAAWPSAAILPVEVPLIDAAPQVGIATAERIAAMPGTSAVFLASSDLTHYGPSYRFAPAGLGLGGLAWARDNDRRLLDAVQAMDVEHVVGIVRENSSACGGGAIAAMLAACRQLGATEATVLRHTNSYETLLAAGATGAGESENAVGYASVVVG